MVNGTDHEKSKQSKIKHMGTFQHTSLVLGQLLLCRIQTGGQIFKYISNRFSIDFNYLVYLIKILPSTTPANQHCNQLIECQTQKVKLLHKYRIFLILDLIYSEMVQVFLFYFCTKHKSGRSLKNGILCDGTGGCSDS